MNINSPLTQEGFEDIVNRFALYTSALYTTDVMYKEFDKANQKSIERLDIDSNCYLDWNENISRMAGSEKAFRESLVKSVSAAKVELQCAFRFLKITGKDKDIFGDSISYATRQENIDKFLNILVDEVGSTIAMLPPESKNIFSKTVEIIAHKSRPFTPINIKEDIASRPSDNNVHYSDFDLENEIIMREETNNDKEI